MFFIGIQTLIKVQVCLELNRSITVLLGLMNTKLKCIIFKKNSMFVCSHYAMINISNRYSYDLLLHDLINLHRMFKGVPERLRLRIQ